MDVGVADHRLGHTRASLSAVGERSEREEIALQGDQRWSSAGSGRDARGQVEPRVELVDFAVRVDARIVFARTVAAEQRRLTGIAGPRVIVTARVIRRDARQEPRPEAEPLPTPESSRRSAVRLLTWYAAATAAICRRAKPSTRYHIRVSEIMLQQTQVDRVLPPFAEWLDELSVIRGAGGRARAGSHRHVSTRSGTTCARGGCRRLPARPSRATAASCPRTRPRSCRSKALARTPPARSAASHFTNGRRSWTRTSRASCSASSSARGTRRVMR